LGLDWRQTAKMLPLWRLDTLKQEGVVLHRAAHLQVLQT
jgi:hypothetical protein